MGTRTQVRIEHHLEAALDEAENNEVKYHLREARQLLDVEKRRAAPRTV